MVPVKSSSGCVAGGRLRKEQRAMGRDKDLVQHQGFASSASKTDDVPCVFNLVICFRNEQERGGGCLPLCGGWENCSAERPLCAIAATRKAPATTDQIPAVDSF